MFKPLWQDPHAAELSVQATRRTGRLNLSRWADLAEAGLPSAEQAPRCGADVEVGRGGKVRVALEMDAGATFREIMAEAGKAVTDAVLRKHGGCVNDAMRDLGISKWLWYRLRNRWNRIRGQ